MRRAIGVFLLSTACLLTARPRHEERRDFARTAPLAAGRSFRIEHSNGNINIRGHAKNEAVIRAVIRCASDDLEDARRCARETQIHVLETSVGVSVRTDYPEHERNLSFGVDYEIAIPDAAPVDVRSQFGSVTVAGVRAPATIRNGNGRVSLSDGEGAQRIENSFGAVDALRIAGDLTVVNQNGQVRTEDVGGLVSVRNSFGRVAVARAGQGVTVDNRNGQVEVSSARGTARLETSFGEVNVTGADADVIVRNQNGAVNLRGVAGAADVRTSFAPVTLTDIGRQATVRAANGAVTGRNIGGSVSVDTSFGRVELTQVKGQARVTAQNTAIRLDGIDGEVYAKTSFGSVEIDDAEGAVTVEDQNGAVTVAVGPAKGCRPIVLHTSFGPMRLALPAGSAYDVTARTSFGNITSDHEIAVTGPVGGNSLSGRMGSGGCEMRLTNQNGKIEIVKPTASGRASAR